MLERRAAEITSNPKTTTAMTGELHSILHSIPQLTQRQDGARDQLCDLAHFANRLGMYDAADVILDTVNKFQTSGKSPQTLDERDK